MKHSAGCPPGTFDGLLAEENRKPLEAVVQTHIVADAAIRAGDLLGRAVEVPTIGGGTLAIDGSTGVILLVPIQAAVTEVEGREVVDQKSEVIPVSAIVVETPQDSVPGRRSPRDARPAGADGGHGGRARYRSGQWRYPWHRLDASATRGATVVLSRGER
jgi:hypothetical protein